MTSSSSREWAYDVFVNYRAEDVHKTFMNHLFSDLKRKGIHAYGDNDHLNRREDASIQLYKAIEESRFLLIIFSQNYASSTSCLKELVKILECKERQKEKYEVQPIFYDVNPSNVRNQTGSYKEAFLKHDNFDKTEVLKWRKALTSVANLSGWDLHTLAFGHESKLIDIISKEIFYKLTDGPIHAGENLVGLYARAEQMDLLQIMESNKVHMIGICGIGGIGKTTVAKAIYNLMYKHFDGCSFCEDVKDVVNLNGLVHLQKKVLDDIMKEWDLKIQSVAEGVNIMKRRMKGKKVFIVLDDVDNQNQFEALAGNHDWFSHGSMIVVTSRDRRLLIANQVEPIYEINLLNDDEAHELFNKYALKNKHPQDEFIKLTNRILHYVNGLPLAIKTFGSFLFNKKLHEWEDEIDSLQNSPHVLIQKVLQVSYDGLDAHQKSVFLDIACFFRGEEKDYVMKILGADESFFASNFRVLVDKSLITLCEDRILQMHTLVQEMGRNIVREESEEPGKRSRLWCPTDVIDVLKNDKGTELVKGLSLDLSSSEVNIYGQSFRKLKNIRLLHIYSGAFTNFRDIKGLNCKSELGKGPRLSTISGKLEFLSNELQLLCWHGYPFQNLPSSFYPERLLVLDMSYSCIKQIWSGSKGFKTLTVLKLSHCHNLRKTPDFTETPNLKELLLDGCENLVKIHPSITTLKTLTLLNLEKCKTLKIFPDITELVSLKHLILSGCSKVENLVGIHSSWHSFFTLSSFLRKFRGPQALVLPSFSTLCSLKVLDISHCHISSVGLSNIESLCLLEELDMSGNELMRINANFCRLSRLSCLRLIGCKKLQVIPKLPSSILKLDAQHCIALEELPKLSKVYNGSNVVFDFKNCQKVVKNRTVESLLMVLLPQGRIDIFEDVHIFLPGSRIPGWFRNQCTGDCIKVELPTNWCYEKLKGFSTCAVITAKDPGNTATYFEISCTVKNVLGNPIGDVTLSATDDPNIESDQIWMWYRRADPRWKKANNQIVVSFKCVGVNCMVKQCSVRLICEEEAANGANYLNLDVGSAATEDEPPLKKIRVS